MPIISLKVTGLEFFGSAIQMGRYVLDIVGIEKNQTWLTATLEAVRLAFESKRFLFPPFFGHI
jgi:hypothetical protein